MDRTLISNKALRLECLRLAVSAFGPVKAVHINGRKEAIADCAEHFFSFVTKEIEDTNHDH